VVTNAAWPAQLGSAQLAIGRLYFEMPANKAQTRWQGYVCSGTTIDDNTTGRSVILTASHCVYDDLNKVFARNVLFIPDQAGSGNKTNLDCGDDLHGCWKPAFGVVDANWASRKWPDNIPWDYAFYVVNDLDTNAHIGPDPQILDVLAKLPVSFSPPTVGDPADAIGYSYSSDPNLMYCSEALSTTGTSNWWLPSCGLSGGASGGPWMQPAGTGAGPIFSVNSWGYTNQPGMAGPKLSGTSATCVLSAALARPLPNTSGVAASCP
jgi:hypothetical protein